MYLVSTIAVLLLLPDKWKLDLFKYTFLFFQIGFLTADRGVSGHLQARSTLVLLSAGILSLVCYMLWTKETYVYVTGMILREGNVWNVVLRYTSGLVVSVFALAVMGYIYGKVPDGVKRSVVVLGVDSIYVYIVQNYLFDLLDPVFTRMPFSISSIPGKFALSVCIGWIVAYSCWYLGRNVARSRWAGLLLFGKMRRPGLLEPAPVGAINVLGSGGLS